jgi:YNFM family putative membrane transporter
LAGRLGNRLGNGIAMAIGGAVFGASVLLTLVPVVAAVAASLAGVCAGFFIVHTAAVGALNRKLATSRGRGNSLYVLFYYLGGTAGITASGMAYRRAGWRGVVALVVILLLIPVAAGFFEARLEEHRARR